MTRLRDIEFQFDRPLIDRHDKMSAEIYLCPRRNQGRTLEQVRKATICGILLEHALELQGFKRNPKEFDVTDPDSYAWDVSLSQPGNKEGLTFEVKRCRIDDNRKWFSFYNNQVKTFRKNLHLVDGVIVGDYKMGLDNHVKVQWMLTAPAKNFFQHVYDSKYNKGEMYYNHNQVKESRWLLA